ncbi:hypothetical protein SEPCBS119000_004542 [Sporothrix epigloea]|uniref:Benzoate 4-monooxygenase cytochrome P450 n=1 Tax=Sporothrix epigloea TaxID=1892477 RepID=A0ABP0DSR7_9PEZI
MFLTAAAVVAAVAVTYSIVSSIVNYRKLAHIPGPKWAAWTDFWLVRHCLSGQLVHKMRDVNSQYGKLARIGPNWVVCGDPGEIRRIWAARSSYKRGYWYQGLRLDPYRDNLLSTLDEKLHSALRTKMLPGYGGKDVDGLHEAIDAQVVAFVKLLEDKYLAGDPSKSHVPYRTVDFAHKVQFFTLDIISTIAFGDAFGCLEADADVSRYIEITERVVPTVVAMAVLPWVINLLQSPIVRPLIPRVHNLVGFGSVMTLAKKAVDTRYGEKPVVKRDMLGSFVKHGLSRDEAEGEALMQILAGSDTTATAICATLLYTITSPQVYSRLQREIDKSVHAGRISSPVSFAEARRLPYLQAVIREGLRMWPPAGGLQPKVSTTDDVICGVRVPAGTAVAWSAWTVMHDKSVYGEDAHQFRPERWLDASPEKLRAMEQTAMLGFAGGSRYECLGKNVAMTELNKVLVELLRRFDIVLVDPTQPWKFVNAIVFKQSDMNVRITRREEAFKS